MDGKALTIIILFIVIVGILLFGAILYQKSETMKPLDFRIQESKQNGNFNDYDYNYHYKKLNRFNKLERKYDKIDSPQFEKAVLLYETGDYRKAINILTDIKIQTKSSYKTIPVYYYIAASLVKLKNDKKAMLFLNRIFEKMQPSIWATKATILYGQINRKYQYSNESLEYYLHKAFMETTDETKKNEISTQIGYLKLYRNDLDGAMRQFQKAATPLSRIGKARVFIRQNKYWKAISIYEDILKNRDFKNRDYFNDVKKAFCKQTYFYAKKWFNKKDYDHAYFYFKKIINFFPESVYGEAATFWTGELFFNRRLYSIAIKYYNRVISNSPKNKDKDAYLKKGIAYYNLKKYSSAIHSFNQLINKYDKSANSSRAYNWIKMCKREITYRR